MFDKNTFADIIKKIKETYNSQEEFSKKSEIGRTYLSQYMNKKLDEPPKPKILEKLANASNNITNYAELMFVCGYTNNYVNTTEYDLKKQLFNKYVPNFAELNISDSDIDKIKHIFLGVPYENHYINFEDFLSNFSIKTKNLIKNYYNNMNDEFNTKYYEYFNKSIGHLLNDEEEFKYAYHKEMEGLTDEEITDALRFYKEMKKKMKGNQ